MSHPCDRAPCPNEGIIVVVAVAPQDFSDDPNPKDAITSLGLVCEEHLRDPWIEVKRLGGDR